MKQIYLDYNATTPILGPVQEAMRPFWERHYGNPSSQHAVGRACAEAIQDARERVAAMVGAFSEEIVFTSGGTEANNLALLGALLHGPRPAHLVISAIEHPAVSEPARYLQQQGVELTVVACDTTGMVDPDDVAKAIRGHTRMVSIMHANNELGTIQPIADIARICRKRDVLLHCDAAQSIGKVSADVCELGVDLLSIAGHKFYGPKGIGALCVREGVHLEPIMHGAGHEWGLRPGTENVASIVGLGHAAQLVTEHLTQGNARMMQLRDQLHSLLQSELGDKITLLGHPTERLPNTLNVSFAGLAGAELLARTPEICASTGSACHGLHEQLTPTLQAIGVQPELGRGAVRLSIGWSTSESDVESAASLLTASWEALVA